MAKKNEIKFDLYRYQINPVKLEQLSLFNEAITFSELKQRKNEIFAEHILKKPPKKLIGKGDYFIQGSYSEKNLFTFKFATKKNILHHTKELKDEFIDDYPFVYVMINNNPNSQKIAISRNYRAFNSSQAVINILENNFITLLSSYNLSFSVAPILDKHDFWGLIDKYRDRIYEIRFDIIRPNITNLSKALKEGVKELASTTNSLKTRIALNAPPQNTLENINPENDQIKALSEYSVEGGGDVTFKAKGVSGWIQTSKSIKTWEIDSLQIEGNPDEVAKVFKKTIGK